ncbi:ABC transporter ATP-binding protein/permease [Candidatus Pelagibacter sp.]|nr:ABC transporter ATP-binding protein/permease [Candidatus Pelagibacter sp.]
MKTLKKLSQLLSSKERFKIVLLLLMILIMALIDLLGIASIMPFIAVLSNPELIETNEALSYAYEIGNNFGIVTKNRFLFALGIIVFLLLIISIGFKAITLYFQTRFVKMCEYNIASRLIKSYLYQPYSWFLNRNSATLGKTILSEVSRVVGKGLTPMMNLITNIIVTITIFILLVYVEPKLAGIVLLTMCTFYGLVYYFNRNLLSKIGKELFADNEKRFKVLSEAFGASKEVKVGGLEQIFINQFSKPAKNIALKTALVTIMSEMPRFTLEALAFGGMLLITLYFMTLSSDITNVIPIIALYALAGYRLMPALQKIFISLTSLKIVSPALDSLHNDLRNLKPIILSKNEDALIVNNDICLKNIHYNYPNASKTALKNINLTIPVNKTIGLVGATGSGKTTTVDIILGLLEAQKGTLEVDGEIINNNNRRAWQSSIGYVPQQIFLSDNTVSANIAFGVNHKDIDEEAVMNAAKIANIHNFIMSELPFNYRTTVGERGIRLSGGQRQRIGIARALYHKPKVLILDEATSALDNLTEKAVMDSVHNSEKNITKILIAHRLSSVKNCDKIFLFHKGEIKEQGNFEELLKISDEFKKSVEVN